MTQTVYTVLTPDELKELIRDALRQELNLKKEKEFLNAKEVCELLGNLFVLSQ